MKRFEKLLAFALLSHLAFSLPIAAQSRPKAPALIRDTDKAEGKDDPDTNKQKEYSPLMADKSIKVGNFYFKKKNYVAAIERYNEAIEYQPDSIEACEALARAYEKNGDLAKAAEAYKDFIRKNPESPKISEFRTKLARLEKKQS
jgi:Tfp pilus assembly protein PilF